MEPAMRAEAEAFFAACPQLAGYDARLPSTALAPTVRLVARAHLCKPTTPAAALSATVEIHPSKGTCNYACAMCLWSDKHTLTYAERGLTADGLLTAQDWRRVLRELRQGGTTTLVLSGGGEVLLNRESNYSGGWLSRAVGGL